MKDMLDKEIIPECLEVYNKLKDEALAEINHSPVGESVHKIGYVNRDGKRLTLSLWLTKEQVGTNEQFEYYEYRYFHSRYIK